MSTERRGRVEWHVECAAWTVDDFFEMLEDQFRELRFISLGSTRVIDVYATFGLEEKEVVDSLRKIYREHGWPDLQRYRKNERLQSVQNMLRAHYPIYSVVEQEGLYLMNNSLDVHNTWNGGLSSDLHRSLFSVTVALVVKVEL